jgi:sulfoxide reductase heme-binding subunit YedZ
MNGFSSNAVWYLMRASGVVSLVLLTAVLLLGIATFRRWRPARIPRFVTAGLHRTIALLSVAFLAVHIATAVIDPYAFVGVAAVVVPFVAGKSAFWVGVGALSLDAVAALVVSSLLRSRISARVWRTIHWLAYLSWPLALAHSFGMGSDASSLWLDGIGAACVSAVGASIVWRFGAKREEKHLEPRAVPRERAARIRAGGRSCATARASSARANRRSSVRCTVWASPSRRRAGARGCGGQRPLRPWRRRLSDRAQAERRPRRSRRDRRRQRN